MNNLIKLFLLILLFGLINCNKKTNCNNKVDYLDFIKKAENIDLTVLKNVMIKARTTVNCKYIPYHYIVHYKNKSYKLPNFLYTKEDRYKSFGVDNYLKDKNISLDSLKKESFKIFKTYEVLNAIDIWNVDNATIFFVEKDKYLLYCKDTNLIDSQRWREFLINAKNEKNWYWIDGNG